MKTNGNGWQGKTTCAAAGCRKQAWISGLCPHHLSATNDHRKDA